MTTDPSSDVLERLRKRIERYETGLRVKSFEVGDNPVTDALAADLREVLATIERLSAERMQLREAAAEAKVLIGARNDRLSEVERESNVNRAWHVLNAALSNTAENSK